MSKKLSKNQVEEEIENSSGDDSSEPEVKSKKRGASESAASKKKASKKMKVQPTADDSADGSGAESDPVDSDAEEKAAAKISRGRKKKANGDKKTAKKPEGKKGQSGISKDVQVSKELAAVVGDSKMPRTEIVKRVWAYIKEHKLTDPDDRQFTVCDDKMEKVIGTKRFKSFGMMKYLKHHININV